MRDHRNRLLRLCLGLLLGVSIAGGAQAAAIITIINNDGPGEGFNDPTPTAPVGGNPGTTVGAQRLYVFQYAADIWGSILTSSVQIKVTAQMNPQTCDATSGVLGSASAGSSHRNFANAPFPDTWYQQALANKLAGFDLNPSVNDINITFNSSIGQAACLPQGWYLGVDGQEGNAIELLPVVLHELGHGLGHATITLAGVQMGTPPGPHVYDRFLYDNTQGQHWNEMATDGQRGASSQNCSNLAWDGPRVTSAAGARLGPKPLLRVNSPATVAGDYDVGLPSFGPALGTPGVTGDVVLVNDGTGVPTNGCEPILNDVNGKIAFVDRGGCTFTIKVKNAQDAGAIGVVVADSVPGCPALGMSGTDPTIVIPTVRLTNDDGQTIKTQLVTGVNATLTADPSLDAGADSQGRVLVYTPVPFATGSSVSHWDISPSPNLLMEPALNPDLSSDVDLSLQQMQDIGWFSDLVSVPARGEAAGVFLAAPRPNPSAIGSAVTFRLDRPEFVRLAITDVSGRRIRTLHFGVLPAGEHTRHWDGRTDHLGLTPAGVYLVSLTTSQGVSSERLVVTR